MKRHNVDHMLFGIAELALCVMLLGCLAIATLAGSIVAATCAVMVSASLALVATLHVRTTRTSVPDERIEDAATSLSAVPQDNTTSHQDVTPQEQVSTPALPALPDDLPSNVVTLNLAEATPVERDAIAPTPSIAQDARDDNTLSIQPAPTPVLPQQQDLEPSVSSLDFAALSKELQEATAPLSVLKRFVGDIRTREADENATPRPCDLERYAVRMLTEAGLFSTDIDLPSVTVVRPHASRMVYLRCTDGRIPYLAKLRLIKLEAALNAIRFACASLPADATLQQAYQLNQGLTRSVVAQALPIDQPLDLTEIGTWPEGEWTVRYGISQAIETLQLPYRLVARYRTNVADGNVAIEIELTPAEVFPSSCHVDGLDIVPTTGDMRQRASADYALRLGLLMAASAFRCSERIRHVWVAGIQETATRRSCYYSVDFDRWRFARIDLEDIGDLSETYRSFAPVLRYEDGWLRPVKQSFHLEEERFCPTRRYLPVSLSSRRLDKHAAESLGTDHVSGLSIEEADGRALVANAIMMRLAPGSERNATQKNVRTVMDLAGDDPDPTVRSAAERVVRGLVEGTLGDDVFAIGEEFVRGDALTRANDRAKRLLLTQHANQAHQLLAPLLARIDETGVYQDTSTVVYRYFNSYVERALYNRRQADAHATQTTMLVPDAYYEAHLLVSITCLAGGMYEDALVHAQRLVELAPLDARARLHVVQCLEMLERDDEAIAQLIELLGFAHEPQGLGLAYYRMAFFQWKHGNVAAAQACYQCAMHFLPGAVPMMAMELSVLYLQNPDMVQQEFSEEQVADTLAAAGIPLAPTEQTSEVFYDCARASLDAEIFPVARTFARILAMFASDDVVSGVLRSLEDEPDRL